MPLFQKILLALVVCVGGGIIIFSVADFYSKLTPTATEPVVAKAARASEPAEQIAAPVQNPTSSDLITVRFFGDIMLDRNVARAMATSGLDYLLGDFKNEGGLAGADYLIANLEGPFAQTRIKTTKSIAFRFDPNLAKQLKAYGFFGFSLANNHALDMGWKNLYFTKQTLTENGLQYFGDETREGPEFTLVAGKIAFVGINNTDHVLNMADLKNALDEAHKKAEYVLVMPHWGTEYATTSNKNQRELAHWLIDNGATAVVGGHPHVTEETETYKGRPIFYSLGNFIFDQYFSAETQQGLGVELVLGGGGVQSYKLLPIFGVKSRVHLKNSAQNSLP